MPLLLGVGPALIDFYNRGVGFLKTRGIDIKNRGSLTRGVAANK